MGWTPGGPGPLTGWPVGHSLRPGRQWRQSMPSRRPLSQSHCQRLRAPGSGNPRGLTGGPHSTGKGQSPPGTGTVCRAFRPGVLIQPTISYSSFDLFLRERSNVEFDICVDISLCRGLILSSARALVANSIPWQFISLRFVSFSPRIPCADIVASLRRLRCVVELNPFSEPGSDPVQLAR